MEILVQQDVLHDNAREAARNRERFARDGVYVLNLMSGPGAGKTTLVERTAQHFQGKLRMAVINGDIETRRDADRIERAGVPVLQINTGGACHLEADTIARAADQLDPAHLDFLLIENVGNLVCPAEFDLGEHDKAMILSVTEGDDKPGKYPLMFREARVMLLNKIDLLPYVDFDPDAAERDARALKPDLEVLRMSTRSGAGLDAWYAWIERRIRAVRT
jgi:hydrogenase nickel incorporation protein HypB